MQRVFIGIPVDRRLQRQINQILKPVKSSHPKIRWVTEINRHLTLAFPGDLPFERVETLVRQFDKTYQGEMQFQYRFSKLTGFPAARSALLALTGERDAAMDHLQKVTRNLLEKNGIGFDSKKFRPHITLGRNKRAEHVAINDCQALEIDLSVDKVRLYHSTLTKSGSIYSTLKETSLRKPPEL